MSGYEQRSAADVAHLVARAVNNDNQAWSELVDRYQRAVWKAVNMVTTDHETRCDAFNQTWERLHRALPSIREPERLVGWLTTTATREAIALSRKRSRYVLSLDDTIAGEPNGAGTHSMNTTNNAHGEPGDSLLDAELHTAVRAAFSQLDDMCRQLLTLLILRDPPMSYQTVEEELDRPHGWVGPTRMRCLDKLRKSPKLLDFTNGQPASATRLASPSPTTPVVGS